MEVVTRPARAKCLGRWMRPGAILTCLTIGLLLGSRFSQAADEPFEYQVKAAFLLNFTKFVEWPATSFRQAESPITICILGEDPFGTTLVQLVAGEIVSERKVVVERIKRPPPPKSCQVLFVGRDEKNSSKILSGLGPGVLTVGEGESFLRKGGIIAFVLENRRVRFSVNQMAAESGDLKLSSKLLSVARSVE
jgi:hypothetical protein